MVHEIAMLRLTAQRIAGPGWATATEAVRWLTAVQAQDHSGALISVALRTASGTRRGVEAALDAGEIVRSWPMQGGRSDPSGVRHLAVRCRWSGGCTASGGFMRSRM